MGKLHLSVGIGLLFFGCNGPPPEPHQDSTGQAPRIQPAEAIVPTAAAVELCTSDADYAAERFATRFVLGSFDDWVARVRFSGPVPFGKTLALQIHGPDGGLVTVYRRPIASRELQIVVPVEGTDFSKRSLTGRFAILAVIEPGGQQLGETTVELAEK